MEEESSVQEQNIASLLLLAYDISMTYSYKLLPTASIVPTSSDTLKAKYSTTAGVTAETDPSVLVIIDKYFGDSWPVLDPTKINNKDMFIDISNIQTTHQLLLYTVLDSSYLTLEAAYSQQEHALAQQHGMDGYTARPHTDNYDDDMESLASPQQSTGEKAVSELFQYHKKQILMDLNNITNILAAALQLNIMQKSFVLALWKIDNNMDVLWATDELCRQVYRLDRDVCLFEVIIQRLLSINTDNCLRSVDMLIHYFINNEEPVGVMLKYGTIVPSVHTITLTTDIDGIDVAASNSNTATTTTANNNSNTNKSRIGFCPLALAASHLNEFGYIVSINIYSYDCFL